MQHLLHKSAVFHTSVNISMAVKATLAELVKDFPAELMKDSATALMKDSQLNNS